MKRELLLGVTLLVALSPLAWLAHQDNRQMRQGYCTHIWGWKVNTTEFPKGLHIATVDMEKALTINGRLIDTAARYDLQSELPRTRFHENRMGR